MSQRKELSTAKDVLEQKKRASEPRPLSRAKRTSSKAGRKRKLQAQEIESIRAEYSRGDVSMRALASKYDVSPSTMHEYLKGIPHKSLEKNYRYKIAQSDVFLVVRLYRSGMTMAAIASKMGVSESTIWRTIRKRAKTTERYPRKRTERRKRQAQASRQPAIKIDRRLSQRKRKRGVKHENQGRVTVVRRSIEQMGEEGVYSLKKRIETGGKVITNVRDFIDFEYHGRTDYEE